MSCLFDSFSYFLKIPSFQIRQMICDYMEKAFPILDGLDTNTLLSIESPNYVGIMRNQGTQGGAIEIQVACNIWNLVIKVVNIRDHTKDIKFKPLKGIERHKKIKITWNGGHYEPVRLE